jgi:hypothetical protein
MRLRRTIPLALVVWSALAATAVSAAAPPRRLADVYAFFDTLGLPDIRQKPYVEVRFVAPKQEDGTPYDARSYRDRAAGFLLAEDDQSLTVWTHDLYRLVIPRREIAAAADGKPYRPISFADTVAELLERFAPKPREADDRATINKRYFYSSDEPTVLVYRDDLDPKSQLLVVAWLCRRTGVVEMIDVLEERADELEGAAGFRKPESLRDEIASTLAWQLQHRLLNSLGYLRVTWTDAQAEAQRLVKHFPDWEGGREGETNLAELAAMTVLAVKTTRPPDECRRMEAEIAALRKTGGPWKPEHAEYLVYSLRDFSPVREYPWDLFRDQLGDLGRSAMIDHVHDETATRYVDGNNFTAALRIATIGQICWFTLAGHLRERGGDPIDYVAPTEPPQKRAEFKARLRAALLKK